MIAASLTNRGNLKAFLDMIAWAELGPEILSLSQNGYNVLVSSTPSKVKLFHDYSDHPRILVEIHTKDRHGKPDIIYSTAAGRYQILKRIFDAYKPKLKLKDFGPQSQDAIAIQLLQERRALSDIANGDIYKAIEKAASGWASLPGAGYGQHEHRIEPLIVAYRSAGGKIK